MERILELNEGLNEEITLQQYNKNNEKIRIKIEEKKYKYDLTGYTVSLNGVKPDGKYILIPVTVVDVKGGIVEFDIIEQLTIVEGLVTLQLMIIGSGNKIINSTLFSIYIKPSIKMGTPTISNDDFTLLSSKLGDIAEWDRVFTETSGKIEEKYTERLNGVGSQLAERVLKNGDNIRGTFLFNNDNGIRCKTTNEKSTNVGVINTANEIILGSVSEDVVRTIIATKNTRPHYLNKNGLSEIQVLDDKIKQQYLLAKFILKVETNKALKIICQGDSLTYGQDTTSADKRPIATDTTLDGNVTHYFTQAGKTYPEYLQEIFRSLYGSNTANTVNILNRGIEGQTAEWGYQKWSQFKTTGDIVILCYGNNESSTDVDITSFIKNYEKNILMYQDWDIPSIILIPPRMKTLSEDKFRGYKRALKTLALAYGIPCIDGDQFHFGYESQKIFSTDLVHFNTLGYKIIAHRVFSALLQLERKTEVGNNCMVYPYSDRNNYYKKGSCWEQIAGSSRVLNNSNANTMAVVIGANGSLTIPFYTKDMLIVVPIFSKDTAGICNITINTNVEQNRELYKSDGLIFKTLSSFIIPSSQYVYTGNSFNMDIKNTYWDKTKIGVNDSGEKGAPFITSIGYNSITIKNTGTGNIILEGLKFYDLKSI